MQWRGNCQTRKSKVVITRLNRYFVNFIFTDDCKTFFSRFLSSLKNKNVGENKYVSDKNKVYFRFRNANIQENMKKHNNLYR